jgi:hypothetical protein
MSTVKSKKLQVGTSSTSTDNFTIYQPSTPDGTLRIGQGNADNPTEVGQFNANGYKPTTAHTFSVAKNSNQSISSSTYTKCTWDSENWDIGSGFDLANNKFQPTVAGYYQLTVNVRWDGSTSYTRGIVELYKNGSVYKRIGGHADNVTQQNYNSNGSAMVYMNGTTDYVEVYINISASTAVIGNTDAATRLIWWDGHLVAQA